MDADAVFTDAPFRTEPKRCYGMEGCANFVSLRPPDVALSFSPAPICLQHQLASSTSWTAGTGSVYEPSRRETAAVISSTDAPTPAPMAQRGPTHVPLRSRPLHHCTSLPPPLTPHPSTMAARTRAGRGEG
jgi:hypothetical protein